MNQQHSNPRLSLGPNQYFWPADRQQAFYEAVAESPVDIVYLGETVCSKRRLYRFDDWMNSAEMLAEAGKEVVLSTLALLEAESELKTLRRICSNGRFMVEANDMAAVRLLARNKVPFVTGPTVNVYNGRTLSVLAESGLRRWVLPVELSADTLTAIMREAPDGVESEIFAFGRMPLAMSARCYTARAHELPKDDCQYRCIDYPDGLTLRTKEGESFLAINGIQTQSAQTQNLLDDVDEIRRLPVDVLRISPQFRGTNEVIEAFSKRLQGLPVDADRLEKAMPVGSCDGYWHGNAGIARR